jgi:hypothetical protein
MSPMLDAEAIQQRIAAAAAMVRERKSSPIAAIEVPLSRVEVSAAEKKAAQLSKRLNKMRSLLEKLAGDARGFHEARKRETGSLNPARRLGRKRSDKMLTRLFTRIDQMLQTAQAEKEATQTAGARDS